MYLIYVRLTHCFNLFYIFGFLKQKQKTFSNYFKQTIKLKVKASAIISEMIFKPLGQ